MKLLTGNDAVSKLVTLHIFKLRRTLRTNKVGENNVVNGFQRRISSSRQRHRVTAVAVTVGIVTLSVAFPAATSATPLGQDDPFKVSIDQGSAEIADSDGKVLHVTTIRESASDSVYMVFGESSGAGYVRTVNTHKGYAPEPQPEVSSESFETEFVEGGEPIYEKVFISASEMTTLTENDFELSTVIAVNSNSVSLSWDSPEGTDDVVVSVDGNDVNSDESSAIITDLKADTDHLVSVAFIDNSGETPSVIREDTHSLRTLVEGLEDPQASESSAKAISLAATLKSAKAVRYLTFITNQYANSEWFTSAACTLSGTTTPVGWFFGGDNRGYQIPVTAQPLQLAASHRTGFEVMAQLRNAPPQYQGLSYLVSVQPTTRYNTAKQFVDQRTASAAGITVSNLLTVTDVYVSFSVAHQIGNPYCPGAIRYNLSNVTIHDAGTISVSGSRHPVPAHEMYGSFTTASGYGHWGTLYQGAQGDFICTAGYCNQQSISNTVVAP